MRTIVNRKLSFGALAGTLLAAGCGSNQGTGLLYLSISADPQLPDEAASKLVISYPGGTNHAYQGKFPPKDRSTLPLKLQVPNLPANNTPVTFTVQGFDASGCAVTKPATTGAVAIKAGAETAPIAVTLVKSDASCADGGMPIGSADGGSTSFDGAGNGIDGTPSGVDGTGSIGTEAGVAVFDGPTPDAFAIDSTKDSPQPNSAEVGNGADGTDAINSARAEVADAPLGSETGSDVPFGNGGAPGNGGISGSGGGPGTGGTAAGGATGTGGIATGGATGAGGIVSTGGAPSTGGTSGAPLQITSFSSSAQTISAGTSVTLNWTVTGASLVSIDNGVGPVSASSSKVVSPSQNTTYTLTASDGAGHTVTAPVTIKVVALPTIADFVAAAGTITTGHKATLTATFANGTGVVDHSIGSVTTGSPVSTGALTTTTTYTLTVTNEVGDFVTKQVKVTVLSFTAVSVGELHVCALATDGSVVCWGSNTSGQATPPAGTFTSVSAGVSHTCAVQSGGAASCWGSNSQGATTPPTDTLFASLSAGNSFTCGVLKSDASISCWGANGVGQAAAQASSFVSVSAGSTHTCGVKTDGSIACWGQNNSGQASPPPDTFIGVSASYYFSCGLKSDGTVVCWGTSIANTANQVQPPPPATTFTAVSGGGGGQGIDHVCGIKTDKTVACWGDNGVNQSVPPAGTFLSISAGHWNTCGVKTDGSIACWGDNSSGESTPP